ncbi:MAG: hypothetical protein Kow00121_58970 [Elainellaceae cyanobacterium]
MFQLILPASLTFAKNAIALNYRGIPYVVPQNSTHCSGFSSETLAKLVTNKLIYRGARYSLNLAFSSRATAIEKRLTYRGVTYEINAARV